ncbi:MAG: DoxX family protein [Patescibacteria group bacterium]|nr:DoxX family protein [Patescibacteria group bacterium]MDE2438349.1 DoxX family protein [Patescibacteria group bacterium]
MHTIEIPEPALSRFLFSDTRMAWFWLIVRVYIGYEWVMAGWEKLGSAAWTGSSAGVAVKGFLTAALQKAGGQHPDVSGWYSFFIRHIALPHPVFFSYLITYGELAVGVALIFGVFTGIAAFFGTFMNLNYLFAGTVSLNPVMLLFQLLLILAWRTAGWLGLDRYVLPALGTPWQAGEVFHREQ